MDFTKVQLHPDGHYLVNDEVSVPPDPGNRHYAAIVASLANKSITLTAWATVAKTIYTLSEIRALFTDAEFTALATSDSPAARAWLADAQIRGADGIDVTDAAFATGVAALHALGLAPAALRALVPG